MLALAAVNALAALCFAALYAAAGARILNQAAFLAGLVLVFGLATALWARTACRGNVQLLSLLGRGVGGLAAVMIAAPVVVLMPLFALESRLPAGDPASEIVAPIMAILLIALGMVAAVNLAGALVLIGMAVSRRGHARGSTRQ